jgi:hypothetical protein
MTLGRFDLVLRFPLKRRRSQYIYIKPPGFHSAQYMSVSLLELKDNRFFYAGICLVLIARPLHVYGGLGRH